MHFLQTPGTRRAALSGQLERRCRQASHDVDMLISLSLVHYSGDGPFLSRKAAQVIRSIM